MKLVFLKMFFLVLPLMSCAMAQDEIDMFIMDYPHGEHRIHVKRTGDAYLYYGAKPQARVIAKDTFSAGYLYDTFKPYLHKNQPREKWPDPTSQAGMVTIRYVDGEEKDYLIFDLHELTSEIFQVAEKNIAGEVRLEH